MGARERERERNVLFNDTFNTFYLRLYGVRHMVKDHSDSEKGNPLPPHRLSYQLTARVLLYAPSHRQDNTYHGLCYTSRGALAGTRNSSMGPPHEGSIRWPIAPWANALPLSYVRWELDAGTALMVRWVTGSTLIVDPLSYFSFQPVLCNLCSKGCGMCYLFCGMVHIKETHAANGKSSPCGGSRFPILLSKWSSTVCPMPYICCKYK